MNYIKLNFFIFFIIFSLISPKAFAAINDVYYCEMTNLASIEDDKLETWKTQKFKFKRLEKNIIFPKQKNTFNDIKIKVTYTSNSELFTAADGLFNLSYDKGKFHFTSTSFETITLVTAECSIF
jgi:hypothetical protein|tara:strand:+ start:194 stop:565 length:372 start_codon:yes stop_codon:yes gene_type:complete